ncbi:MAG: hypothetical protein ACRDOE_14680, partial [Streptosporangiaceae bacterium]
MAPEPDPELRLAPPPPPAALTGVPLAAAVPAFVAPRDFWLRLALFATLLGAVLTIVYAWVLSRSDALTASNPAGLASYHRVLVPLLALAALVGALLLERLAWLGMLLMLTTSGLALAGGGVWLLPGAVLGCIWAARHSPPARITLGYSL